jgi:hypothetical protein
MAFGPGRNTDVLVAEYDLTAFFNQAGARKSVQAIETTMFGDAAETYIAGKMAGAFSLAGGWDSTALLGSDPALDAVMASAVNKPVSIYPAGDAVGNRVTLGQAIETDYAQDSDVNGMVTAAGTFLVSSPVLGGYSLHALGSETTDTNDVAVDAVASSTLGGIGHLHVSAVSGTTPSMVVRIQDSPDGSTGWADILTFTAATAVTSEHVKITGAVDRWLRAIWTMTGTSPDFTFAVGFGRLKQ